MKNSILSSLIILGIGMPTLTRAQEVQETKNKVSLGYVSSIGDNAKQALHGVELEYKRFLNKRFAVSANLQWDRYNNFPHFANGGNNTNNQDIINHIYNNAKGLGSRWNRIHQSVYTLNLNYSPIHNAQHNLYVIGGLGLNVQDAIEYGIESVTIESSTNKIIDYTDYFSQRSAKTFITQLGLGYDYTLKNNWTIGTNLRLQLPIARDKYFFYRNNGIGFDELGKLGISVGKKF